MTIKLDKETKDIAIKSIERYFDQSFVEEMNLPLGSLQAELLLDFFITEIGPCIYNRAVNDVQNKLQQSVMEVDAYVYSEPFQYWLTKNRSKK